MNLDQINKFFADPAVSEVLINGAVSLTVITARRKLVMDSTFVDNTKMVSWLQDFAFSRGIRLDPLKPWCGGFLPETNLRWHCLIPPLAVDGPILSLRRHSFTTLTLQNFRDPCNLLPRCLALIRNGDPLIVCGATASGKTTFLSSLLREACLEERVVIVESITELPLLSRLWVRCQAKEEGISAGSRVKMETLIEEMLRLRPDRFVVGEIRGQEIVALIKGLTIGHLGLMTTLHAESLHQAMLRLKFLLALYTRATGMDGFSAGLNFAFLTRGDPPVLQELCQVKK